MINIIFDLDGTLIDSRLRLYRLFQQLVPSSKLTFESYWALKRDKVSNEAILANDLGFDAVAIKRFVSDWMERIESPELLVFDTNFPSMHETLERLSSLARLHVCTARQHRQAVIDQMDRLGLLTHLKSIMVTEKRKSKEDLIAAVPELGPQDWIIGDTGKDIQVGQVMGINTCAVLSGFLNEKSLKPYRPNLILQVATEFDP